MYSYTLLLLAAMLVAVSSSNTLRGSPSQELQGMQPQPQQQQQQAQSQSQSQQSQRHRRLVEEVTCELFLRETNYKPDESHPNGHIEGEWVCELPHEKSLELGVTFVKVHEHNLPLLTNANATSGFSSLISSKVVVDLETFTMYLPSDAKASVEVGEHRTSMRRNLVASTGTLPTLMVRVVDKTGHAPNASLAQLRNDVFEDDVCLKSQMEACSYNALKIEPFSSPEEGVSGGVTDLEIDFDLSVNTDRDHLVNAAFLAFKRRFGSFHDSRFGLVMFCMPPGSDSNWGATGWVNDPRSMYSNDWCGYVSGHMHEVGHNLNLEHSAEDGASEYAEYADWSGMMGVSYAADDTKMCFNPAKSFQLGWYTDQQMTIDPLTTAGNNPVQDFVLNGVADYRQNKDSLISLRLEQTSLGPDFYVGYNRQIGINADTGEDGDLVTILRKDTAPDAYGFSWKVAKLHPGAFYELENFNGQGSSVRIRFIGASNGGRDALIQIIDLANYDGDDNEEVEPCEKHTIEVKTDRYPDDTSWNIVETTGLGRGFGISPPKAYTLPEHVYSQEVCLPYNGEYKFTILDVFGDGLCCQQGNGFYRILDSTGTAVISQTEGKTFTKDTPTFQVGANPNPVTIGAPTNAPQPSPTKAPTNEPTNAPQPSPTKAPTQAPQPNPTNAPTQAPQPSPTNAPQPSPTKAPTNSPVSVDDNENCKGQEYTIEITTDEYPGDTSWSILRNMKELYLSEEFGTANTKYESKLCLESNAKYQFIIVDANKDGFNGNGSYRVLDATKNIVIDSGPGADQPEFHMKEHEIEVHAIAHTFAPAPTPVKVCKDKEGKFVLKRKKKTTCKKLTKRNLKKCKRKIGGVRISDICPESCKNPNPIC